MEQTARRKASNKAHDDKLSRMLGTSEKYTDAAVKHHEETAPHLSKSKVKKIADQELKGAVAKPRADRAARKKGGRTKGRGDVNIIIAQKPDQQPMAPMPAGAAPVVPPPRPMMAPQAPPSGVTPTGIPPQMAQGTMGVPGAAGTPPAGLPQRKRGGSVKMDAGAGGALGRLEKAAQYGARK
jgi:hypothetical protein